MTTVSMHDADTDHQVEDVVLGVDTHKDIHVAAVLTLTGGVIAHASFPTTVAGYHQLIAWARSFGEARRAGVEGTGSYGFANAARAVLAGEATAVPKAADGPGGVRV